MPNYNVCKNIYEQNVSDKITMGNWKYDGIQRNHSEFFNNIRNSDAWLKHWMWMSMTNKEVKHLTPSSVKATMLREYQSALNTLIWELDEVESDSCRQMVSYIIKKDHSCLLDEPPTYSLDW